MSIAYLNGDFVPLESAKISVLDRGFLFADGIYEVIPVYSGKVFLLAEHLRRLSYSLDAIDLPLTLNSSDWIEILNALIEKNGGGDLQLYLQVTRGFDPIRQHQFPVELKPTIFICTFPITPRPRAAMSLTAITVNDIRWKRCDIKSISLLPNVMALQQALKAGANEPILVQDGYAIEGSRANLFVVKNQVIMTAPRSHLILGGITRDALIVLARECGYQVKERLIPVAELSAADEIWLTGSISEIRPVVELNGHPVGTGKSGPVWEQIYDVYTAYKQKITHGD